MTQRDPFELVGPRELPPVETPRRRWWQGRPVAALAVLAVLVAGCALSAALDGGQAGYMDLAHASEAPSAQFWLGTDAMGRDLWRMVWAGGAVSLVVGVLAAAVSTAVAVVVGALSGCAPAWADGIAMRAVDVFLSVPSLLLAIFVQAILGEPTVLSLSVVLGLTGWASMAKVVRTEVIRLRRSEYVVAARAMGGGFLYVLVRHLAPNFLSSIMFMVVMSVRSAIVAESTLSFMGLGLPVETVSWGSMLSLAERALMSGAWWVVVVPGVVLVVTLLCVTSVGEWLRAGSGRGESNL